MPTKGVLLEASAKPAATVWKCLLALARIQANNHKSVSVPGSLAEFDEGSGYSGEAAGSLNGSILSRKIAKLKIFQLRAQVSRRSIF